MLWWVVPMLVVAGAPAWAQPNRSARSLIAEAAAFARAGITWKAEGSSVTTEADSKEQPQAQFRIAYQLKPTIRARLEVTSGTDPLLRVCDGSSQWTYYAKSGGYVRVMLPQIGPCAYPINAWPPLTFSMPSPKMAGTERVRFEGRTIQCQVLSGDRPGPYNTLLDVLEMCIDPATKLIVRFRTDETLPVPKIRNIAFSSIQRDVKLDPDLFVFHPPDGSREVGVINWLEPGTRPTGGAVRISDEVPAPTPVRVVAPESGMGLSAANRDRK
jgi:outer membrane lipoprotein-sorting protein